MVYFIPSNYGSSKQNSWIGGNELRSTLGLPVKRKERLQYLKKNGLYKRHHQPTGHYRTVRRSNRGFSGFIKKMLLLD